MIKPWYKQFWPWFLIALPGSVVVASLFTFALFSKNQVSLVAEDYYKEGKGINIDISRLKKADELAISAFLSAQNDTAIFTLDKGELTQYPTLKITFQHRTLADRDIEQMVNADASGRYRLALSEPLTGPWYVEVNAFDGTWALNGRANFPSEDPVELYGQSKE
ncbi:putative CcoH protein [Grimontia indica]|uniref:CcoH protein n=2 Tax=Grimontia TaxID=246861 RepID=R1IIU9_9GAMM|nr:MULTISPECIES: FixH family protein [Grimontia]EOD80661.1 putative CcoH protein [Grimontia indica]NGN96725.1 nitrogen fixation protein FixH [Grimontia sedimenti]